MKEILAESLQPFFDNSGLNGICTYQGKWYEVWEVSDEVFEKMCDMEEEEFVKLCPEGMWRSSEGSIFGCPYEEYEINGHKIIAWDDRRERYIREDCAKCKFKDCEQTEEDYNECFGERKHKSLLDYLCDEIGASSPRNVCALAVDLARYNGMTMGKLFAKYEG